MKKCIQNFICKTPRRDYLGDPDIGGRIILKWIHVARDRYHWKALVNMVMNLLVPLRAGEFVYCVSDCQFLKVSAP
jgi:hypothetical protein